MVQVTADDLRRRLDDYLRRVAAGEDIIVLDGGRVIARITSAGIPKTPSVVREAAGDSLVGAMRGLGPAPSSEEIDLSRRDAWRVFPHTGMSVVARTAGIIQSDVPKLSAEEERRAAEEAVAVAAVERIEG